MTSVDRRPAQYGYGAQPQEGGGYRLHDRAASPVLRDRVLNPLSLLSVGSRVIDLGSGDGNFPHKAGPNRPYDILAIDLEKDAVAAVNKILRGHKREGKDLAVVGDATRLDQVAELNGAPVDAVVSWRVLHGIPGDLHSDIFKQVHSKLRPGGSFLVSVASDQDWKVEALGDQFRPGQTNDCSGVMFRNHGIDREHPFPILFFSEERLKVLAEQSGFVIRDIDTFTEPSGYNHLKSGSDNTYLFAELVKPVNGKKLATSDIILPDSAEFTDLSTEGR